MDITFTPMARGFVYRCSTGSAAACCRGGCRLALDAAFCVETLQDALAITASRTSSTPIRARSST